MLALQDPVNLNRVFVLFGGGGVWRTDNFYATVAGQAGDTTWRPLTNRLPSNGGAIAFGALSNVLYYAIGEGSELMHPAARRRFDGIGSHSTVIGMGPCSPRFAVWYHQPPLPGKLLYPHITQWMPSGIFGG